MSNEYETITLEFEDAASEECEIIGVFEVDEKEYIALLPVATSDDDDEAEVFLYRYKEVGEEEFELEDIEDEAEFEKVAKEFNEIMDEEE